MASYGTAECSKCYVRLPKPEMRPSSKIIGFTSRRTRVYYDRSGNIRGRSDSGGGGGVRTKEIWLCKKCHRKELLKLMVLLSGIFIFVWFLWLAASQPKPARADQAAPYALHSRLSQTYFWEGGGSSREGGNFRSVGGHTDLAMDDSFGGFKRGYPLVGCICPNSSAPVPTEAVKRPFKAHFVITSRGRFTLNYIVQDDKEHFVRELVVPANTEVPIQIALEPRLSFLEHEIYFGCDESLVDENKPRAIEWFVPFIREGVRRSGKPDAEHPGHYTDYNGFYHVRGLSVHDGCSHHRL